MKHHHHILLLTLAVSVTILVAAVYSYMQYAVGVSVSRAVAARDIVNLEKAGKEHEQELRSLYEDTATDRARLSTFFIPAGRVVDFIEALEALGPETGGKVVISAIDADIPEKPTDGSTTFGAARARVEAVGSWPSVMRTLSLAESLPYAVYVSSVRLDRVSAPGETGAKQWKLIFSIEAPVLVASSSPQSN